MAASHSKNHFSSSTSAISSARGRTKSAHAFVHVRSVSSTTLPIDSGTVKPIMPSTKAPTSNSLRQKTEMLPPAFIPVRRSTKTVSVTRSTSAVESRPRVVSTTLPLRAGEAPESYQFHSLPVRPKSATNYREVAQCLHPQPLVLDISGPSGPRRVPISGAGSKVEETNTRAQAPMVRRSRAVSNPNGPSDARIPITRALQVPAREKSKLRPPASSPAPTSSDTFKPSKTSGVTQPTLSQISRAKATADQRQLNINAPKARGANAKGVPSSISISNRRSAEKDGPKSTDTGTKKPVQPVKIPLPPSPTTSGPLCEELCSFTRAPEMELQAEMAAATSKPDQDEDVALQAVIQSLQDDDAIDCVRRAVQHGDKTEPSHQETTEQPIEDHIKQEGPRTPTILSTDISDASAKTPISSLLASIQRGFMLTPSSPLSPPHAYASRGADMAIPFPLGIDGSKAEENVKDGMKPFMFGIGDDYGHSTLGSVEKLNFHKD